MSWVNIILGCALVMLGSAFWSVAMALARGEQLSPERQLLAEFLPIIAMIVSMVVAFGGFRLIQAGFGS